MSFFVYSSKTSIFYFLTLLSSIHSCNCFPYFPQYARRAKLYTNVHAKVRLPAAPASPNHDCKASAAEAGGREMAMNKSAGKGLAAKGGSSSLSSSAAMGTGGDKSSGDRGVGGENGVASKITQQQRSKETRRKSLKRL